MGASGVSRNPRPPARGRLLPDKKPRSIVTAKNEACVTCHGEKTPGIVAQWEDSTHATLGVGCADYHAANKGSPDAWEREGEDPRFFREFGPTGYSLGVNVLLYAMSH